MDNDKTVVFNCACGAVAGSRLLFDSWSICGGVIGGVVWLCDSCAVSVADLLMSHVDANGRPAPVFLLSPINPKREN